MDTCLQTDSWLAHFAWILMLSAIFTFYTGTQTTWWETWQIAAQWR